MIQGNLNLNGNSVTLGISVATNGSLSRSAGNMFGSGSLTRWFKALTIPDGAITGLFPMGTASDYRPFFVSAPAVAATTGGTISVTYSDATSNTSTSIPDGVFTVLLRKDLSWNVTTANGLAGGTYNLRVEGTSLGAVGDVADLRLTLLNSVIGTSGTNAGTISNPQINRTGLSVAGLTNNFYIGTVNPNNEFSPIDICFVQSYSIEDKVELTWKVTSDVNSGVFVVQRSKDGIHWQNIETVVPAVTSGSLAFYKVTDKSPYNGERNYYRIRKENVDESISYSPVISLHPNVSTFKLSIYPNPANNYLNISTEYGKYELSIVSDHGHLIQAESFSGNTHKLNLNKLHSGLYYLVIRNEGNKIVKSIMINR